MGEDRKDIGMLLRVFYSIFKDKENAPALILKTSGAGFSIIDRNDIKKKIDKVKNATKIITDLASPKSLKCVWRHHGSTSFKV